MNITMCLLSNSVLLTCDQAFTPFFLTSYITFDLFSLSRLWFAVSALLLTQQNNVLPPCGFYLLHAVLISTACGTLSQQRFIFHCGVLHTWTPQAQNQAKQFCFFFLISQLGEDVRNEEQFMTQNRFCGFELVTETFIMFSLSVWACSVLYK